MKNEPLEILTGAALIFANTDGVRSGASLAIEHMAEAMGAKLAFAAVRREDGAMADLIGSCGVGAADFRRLEARLAKSLLWQAVDRSTPIAIDDLTRESSLGFLGFATGTRIMLAQPISFRGKTLGLLALGFSGTTRVDEDLVLKILAGISTQISQAMRVEQALTERNATLAAENTSLKHELKARYSFKNLVGNSREMRRVIDRITQAARSNATILLRGDAGTGKDFIADAIHYNSLRSKRPLIKLDCGSLPGEMIETALFGSDRSRKKGAFEAADGGTLLIDEISAMPRPVQDRFLQALVSGEFRGFSGDIIRINIRLVIAASRNLEDEVAGALLNPELFERISASTVMLPPLRERKADILLLAEHFVEKYQIEHSKSIRRLSTPAIDMLTAYHFPGNVRELENVIERAVIACEASVIHGHHLPPTLQTAEVTGTETRLTLTSAVENFERDLILDTLKSTRGNIARAARMLDSTERILGYKVKKYDVDPRRFR